MMPKKCFLFCLTLSIFLLGSIAHAKDNEIKISTTPIGSNYYRHLAFDTNVNLKKLHRYENKGFGRTEIITLILLSQITGQELKDYGKRRLKNQATLKEMTEEAGLDYVTLYKIVQVLKANIESKAGAHLPPPVFDKKYDKKKDKIEQTRQEAMDEIKKESKDVK